MALFRILLQTFLLWLSFTRRMFLRCIMRSLALSLKLLFLFFGIWEMNQNYYSTFKLVFDYASGSAGNILPETGRALVENVSSRRRPSFWDTLKILFKFYMKALQRFFNY